METGPSSAAATSFFAVSPLMLFPHTNGDFAVYLLQEDGYVLYTRAGTTFTAAHRQKLYEHGVNKVWVLSGQRQAYENYVELHLGDLLLDDDLPMEVRSEVFYNVSLDIVKDALEHRLPSSLGEKHFNRISYMVRASTAWLSRRDALRNLGRLIHHDYKTYSHCVNVFVYTTAVLQTYDYSEERLVDCGLGAVLHDIGKTRIPRHVLNKSSKLTAEERRQVNRHPIEGVAMCARLPLSQAAVNCIMFHHERENGGGYPAGIKGRDLPLAAKAVAVADCYDALTSRRPYAEARSPFAALKMMKEDMTGHFNPEVFRRLVMVLAGADIVEFP